MKVDALFRILVSALFFSAIPVIVYFIVDRVALLLP